MENESTVKFRHAKKSTKIGNMIFVDSVLFFETIHRYNYLF